MTFESRSLAKLYSMVPPEPYAVAVSGGIDSMTLMLLIALCHKTRSVRLPTILTVNHGFRAEAVKEVEFVRAQALELGLECHILQTNRSVTNKSQATAREIRYGLIGQWCLAHGVQHVLTAHTKNDQAETVLLHLERGSGLDGLAGMYERSTRDNFVIVRPLLDFTREEILEYARAKQLSWIEDPSNDSPKYQRTFYRRFVRDHEEPETLVNRLCTTAQHMQKALRCIMYYLQEAAEKCLEFNSLGYLTIRAGVFRSVPEEVARRLLLYVFMTIGNKDLKPRYAKFLPAFCKIWEGRDFSPFTISGCKVINVTENEVIVAREVAQISKTKPINGQTCISWDNRFELSFHDINHESVQRAIQALSHNKLQDFSEDTGKPNLVATDLSLELWVAPLNTAPIPDSLRYINRDVVKGLPVLVYRGEVIAYPLQKDGIHGIPSIRLERVLLRERLIGLVCNQL